jgi:hypothetical protein
VSKLDQDLSPPSRRAISRRQNAPAIRVATEPIVTHSQDIAEPERQITSSVGGAPVPFLTQNEPVSSSDAPPGSASMSSVQVNPSGQEQ